MEKQSNVERLSGYIILIGILAIAGALCWYFRSVLMYIILAFVVSLVSRPLVSLMRKVQVKGKSAPDWLLAILSIFFVIAGLSLVVTQAIPVVVNIIREAAVFNDMNLSGSDISDTVNGWVVGLFPSLGPDYDAISVILDYLKNATSGFSIAGLLGSVAGAVVNLAVGLFAVVFISFFFVKDDKLFSRIVAALVPDPIEGKVTDAIGDIERLLSRYFVGLLLEMLCVAFFNFLGLSLIARIGANYAQIRRRGRPGCQHLDLCPHRAGHHAGRAAHRQFRPAAPDLLHQHPGVTVGNLHRDADGRPPRRNRRDAGGHPGLHDHPRGGRPLLLRQENSPASDAGLGKRSKRLRNLSAYGRRIWTSPSRPSLMIWEDRPEAPVPKGFGTT